MHSVFLVKIMSTIFDFNDSGRLGSERNYLYQMGEWQEKIKKGVGVVEWILLLWLLVLPFPTPFLHPQPDPNLLICINH